MKEKIKKCKKIDTNFVGATLGRPTFEEYTQTAPKIRSNLNFKFQTLTSNAKGITLIALIITIIVMVILVGVTVSVAINGGLFTNAKQAKTDTQNAIDSENELSEGKVNIEETLYNSMDEYLGTPVQGGSVTEVKVTVDGQPVTLTPENVGQYLGKQVTNYKTGSEETETIEIEETSYTVSTKYRLFYVDFTGKFGDAGSIYLKADSTTETVYKTIPTTDTTLPTDSKIKIRDLNPELYKEGVTSPNENNNNIKAIKWLTNASNWEGLKQGVNAEISENINYIVGAPSLEMLIDSYNAHYKLSGDTLDTSILDENSNRVKLFYKYPCTDCGGGDSNNTGYGVGPATEYYSRNGYWFQTSDYSLKADASIGWMYCPSGSFYCLASPSCHADSWIYIAHDYKRWNNNRC